MTNEALLIISLLAFFSSLVAVYARFGEAGLLCMNILAVVCSNIEVGILVNAFGMEMTLGNVCFAATFLITDILSEMHSRKSAEQAVNIGIWISIIFVLITRSWFFYAPSENDIIHPFIKLVFANTPRLVASSLITYAVVQKLDIFLYHRIWELTTRLSGSTERFLWLRNNAATIISQLINSFLFNFAAFYGVYPLPTLLSISLASFAVFIVTSLLDTPFLFWARAIARRAKPKDAK